MRAAPVVVTIALALGLSACVAPSAYPAFDREATAVDALPPVFEKDEFDEFDGWASRYAGSLDGRDYYLIKTEPLGGMCLAVDAGESSMIACGGGSKLGASGPGYEAELAPAPLEERDGWTILGDNVRVAD